MVCNMLTWLNPEEFQPDALYVDDHGDWTVEYVGPAEMFELLDAGISERVLVFRLWPDGNLYFATERGWRDGQTFTPFIDRVIFDEEVDGPGGE
jgi:hypothetical protein